MKIRLTITRTEWVHKLQAKSAPNGTYWVRLIQQSGEPFAHGKIIGGFESLDRIASAAPLIYADLLAALPSESQSIKPIDPSRN